MGCHHTQPPSPNPDFPRAGRTFWAASPQIIAGQQSPSPPPAPGLTLRGGPTGEALVLRVRGRWFPNSSPSSSAPFICCLPRLPAPAALPAFPSWQGSST